MPNPETAMYDHAMAVSRGKHVEKLEALMHAILRRHHPNGCEVSEIDLLAYEGDHGLTLQLSNNAQRRTVIVSSPDRASRDSQKDAR